MTTGRTASHPGAYTVAGMTPGAPLPQAPARVVDPSGEPAFGTYEGAFAAVDLGALRPPHARSGLARLRHHKKWVYAFASDDAVSVLCAIVDTTYASTAFVMVTDMRSGQVVVDRSVMGGPGPATAVSDEPAEGLASAFRSPLGRVRVARAAGTGEYRLTFDSTPPTEAIASTVAPVTRAIRSAAAHVPLVGGHLPGPGPGAPAAEPGASGRIRIDLAFEAGSTPELSVVAPVEEGGGSVNVTQKVAGLPVRGTVTAGGRTWRVESAVGGLDYTHGYLARHTAWNWAFLVGRLEDGRRLGLNLVAGFNEARDDVNENALWVDDRLVPVDRARFTWDAQDPSGPWAVRTLDGVVDLTFRPYAVHSERKNLVVVDSRFVQPVGVFSGTIQLDGEQLEISMMPGVTEDQDIRW